MTRKPRPISREQERILRYIRYAQNSGHERVTRYELAKAFNLSDGALLVELQALRSAGYLKWTSYQFDETYELIAVKDGV